MCRNHSVMYTHPALLTAFDKGWLNKQHKTKQSHSEQHTSDPTKRDSTNKRNASSTPR